MPTLVPIKHTPIISTIGSSKSARSNIHENDNDWYKYYSLLLKFKCKHGHCFVSSVHGRKLLHAWTTRQRQLYHHQLSSSSSSLMLFLDNKKIQLLNEIGFSWYHEKRSDYKWYQNYQELCMLYKQQGHVQMISRKCNRRLGCWVDYQRTLHRSGKLSAVRVELLDQLGLDWSGRKRNCDKAMKDQGSNNLETMPTLASIRNETNKQKYYPVSSNSEESSRLMTLCEVAALQSKVSEPQSHSSMNHQSKTQSQANQQMSYESKSNLYPIVSSFKMSTFDSSTIKTKHIIIQPRLDVMLSK